MEPSVGAVVGFGASRVEKPVALRFSNAAVEVAGVGPGAVVSPQEVVG